MGEIQGLFLAIRGLFLEIKVISEIKAGEVIVESPYKCCCQGGRQKKWTQGLNI